MSDGPPQQTLVRVAYLEQSEPAPQPALYWGSERIALERLARGEYLALYRSVGAPLRWDQRLKMPRRNSMPCSRASRCISTFCAT